MAGPTRDPRRTLREQEEEPDRLAPAAPPPEEEEWEGGSDVEGRPGDEHMASDEERGLAGAHRTGLPAELGEGEVER